MGVAEKTGKTKMWRARIPQRDPDGYVAAGLVVGLPAILLVLHAAPVLWTLLGAAIIGGAMIAVR